MVKPRKRGVLKSYSHPLSFSEIHGTSLTIRWTGTPSVYSAIRIGKTVYQVFVMHSSFKIHINWSSLVMLLLCILEKMKIKHVIGMHKQ